MPYNLDILDPDNLGLEDLAKMEENFNILDDSRIVEHNLDVADPSNGYYVRWENGLQVCFREVTLEYDAEHNLRKLAILPADFVDTKYSVSFGNSGSVKDIEFSAEEMGLCWNQTAVEGVDEVFCILRYTGSENFQSVDTYKVNIIAIGRWK